MKVEEDVKTLEAETSTNSQTDVPVSQMSLREQLMRQWPDRNWEIR